MMQAASAYVRSGAICSVPVRTSAPLTTNKGKDGIGKAACLCKHPDEDQGVTMPGYKLCDIAGC
jgi:hypothetical protein